MRLCIPRKITARQLPVLYRRDERSGRGAIDLENSLRLALDRKELFLVITADGYCTGKITGWKRCSAGNTRNWSCAPDKFIKIAENSGLIMSIGEWVLRTACLQARKWQTRASRSAGAVNVSAVQFRHDGFRDLIRRVLHETDCSRYVELELTESLLLSNADVTSRFCRR